MGLVLPDEQASELRRCVSDLEVKALLMRSESLSASAPRSNGVVEEVDTDPTKPRLLLAHQGWGSARSTVQLGWGLRGQSSFHQTASM